MMRHRWHPWLTVAIVAMVAVPVRAQQPLQLPDTAAPAITQAADRFEFVADGPVGPGWTRPNEPARKYFHEMLPALFNRTVAIEGDLPQGAALRWIFTGPRAGLTVELSEGNIKLLERWYDSTQLLGEKGTFIRQEKAFTGHPHTLTVVADAHLSVHILINGQDLLQAPMYFDVQRHQMMLVAPRTQHLVVRGALLPPEVKTASLQIDADNKQQTMLGFGGSPGIPAYAELSERGKTEYWHLIRKYNLLLHREYPMGTELKQDLSNFDDLSSATPHYYGDNFPNGEVSDFDYSRRMLGLGGHVIYEMWALPKWAEKPYDGPVKIIDAWKKPVTKQADVEQYVRIVVAYCRMAAKKSGRAPMIVGIQNEVEQIPSVYAEMTKTLRRELDKAGFKEVKIHMADAPYLWMGVGRVNDLKHDTEAWKDTDYVASHVYDWQKYAADPDRYDEQLQAMRAAMGDKPYLATEICLNDGKLQEPSYRVAFQVGQLYHKHLTELNAIALMYCWTILDVEQPNFGASRSLLIPDKTHGNVPVASSFQLRILGAYSRHIQEGMWRVSAAAPGNADLLVSAFAGAAGKKTIVLLNRGTDAARVEIPWNAPWRQMEHVTQYEENEVVVAKPGLRDVVIQPGEIVIVSTLEGGN